MLDIANKTTLEVKKSRLTLILTILLGLFFVPMGVGLAVSGLGRGEVVWLGIGGVMVLLFAFLAFIFVRADKKGVKYLSPTGVGLADGIERPWSSLKRIVDKMSVYHAGQKRLWRTELQFTDGRVAWLIPNKVSNFADVHAFLESVTCEHAQEDA